MHIRPYFIWQWPVKVKFKFCWGRNRLLACISQPASHTASLTPVCRSPTGFSSKRSFHFLLLWRKTFYLHPPLTRVAGLHWKSIFCVRWLNCWKAKPRLTKNLQMRASISISNIMANLGFSVPCSKLQWQWSWVNVETLECISEVLWCVEHIAEIECRCVSAAWC